MLAKSESTVGALAGAVKEEISPNPLVNHE